MIYEGPYSRNIRRHADAVVIGSGAGGAAAAMELALAGLDVVVVEKGPFLSASRADFRQRWDHAFATMGGRRGLSVSSDNGVNLTYAEAVGGSTVHYWADAFRLPEDRFGGWDGMLGGAWAAAGGYEEVVVRLAQRAENLLSVRPVPEYLQNATNKPIRLGAARCAKEAADPAEAARWRTGVIPRAEKHCIGCSYCEPGCAYNRKQSQLITAVPIASRAGAEIFANARVRGILLDNPLRPRRAVGVEASLAGGATLTVRAPLVLLGANALTAVELLLTGNDGLPVLPPGAPALANVGRHLVVNPFIPVYAFWCEEMNTHRGPPAATTISGFRTVRADPNGRYRDGGWTVIPDIRDPSTMAALLSSFGAPHRTLLEGYPVSASVGSVIDDAQHPENLVEVDPSSGDWEVRYRIRNAPDGDPQRQDREKCLDYLEKMTLVFLAAGAERVLIPITRPGLEIPAGTHPDEVGRLIRERVSLAPNTIPVAGPHLLSTARAGADPGASVCDPFGEVHGLDGLYVVSGAALPTSVSKDPALTITTWAMWVARNLLRVEAGRDLVRLVHYRDAFLTTHLVDAPDDPPLAGVVPGYDQTDVPYIEAYQRGDLDPAGLLDWAAPEVAGRGWAVDPASLDRGAGRGGAAVPGLPEASLPWLPAGALAPHGADAFDLDGTPLEDESDAIPDEDLAPPSSCPPAV